MGCQWQTIGSLQLQCQALDEEVLTGVYRSVRRSIPENLNIQSVKTVLLQQRLLEFSHELVAVTFLQLPYSLSYI